MSLFQVGCKGCGIVRVPKKKAEELGLTGWVKNTVEGNVEAVFEGDESMVNEMIAWCRKGPPLAQGR